MRIFRAGASTGCVGAGPAGVRGAAGTLDDTGDTGDTGDMGDIGDVGDVGDVGGGGGARMAARRARALGRTHGRNLCLGGQQCLHLALERRRSYAVAHGVEEEAADRRRQRAQPHAGIVFQIAVEQLGGERSVRHGAAPSPPSPPTDAMMAAARYRRRHRAPPIIARLPLAALRTHARPRTPMPPVRKRSIRDKEHAKLKEAYGTDCARLYFGILCIVSLLAAVTVANDAAIHLVLGPPPAPPPPRCRRGTAWGRS